MLKHLYIKNFTLIDELDIDLYKGFSVMTGETGAGKSIILGAIGLLLGQRADIKAIKQGAEKCVIEAQFDLSRYDMEDFFTENDIEYDAEETIIRRELTSAGKSRAFINDTPVQLSMLKELGERLVDVHSQHQNLLLNKQDFQMNVVDIIADDAKQLAQYQKVYSEYHAPLSSLRPCAMILSVIARTSTSCSSNATNLWGPTFKRVNRKNLNNRATRWLTLKTSRVHSIPPTMLSLQKVQAW